MNGKAHRRKGRWAYGLMGLKAYFFSPSVFGAVALLSWRVA